MYMFPIWNEHKLHENYHKAYHCATSEFIQCCTYESNADYKIESVSTTVFLWIVVVFITGARVTCNISTLIQTPMIAKQLSQNRSAKQEGDLRRGDNV